MVSPAARSAVMVTLAAAATSAGAADWRVTPVVSSGIGYIDNPRLIPHSDQAYANYEADLSAPMSYDNGRSALSLTPRLVVASYPEDSLLDRNDKYVSLDAQRRFETANWAASVDFVRDTTLTSELGLTGLQEVNRPHESLSATVGPTLQLSDRTQAGAQLYWSENTYTDADFTGLVDYRYSLAAVNAKHVWTPQLSVSLQGSFAQLQVPSREMHTNYINATASLEWQYSELWRAQFSFGPSRVESPGSDLQGYVYSAGARRTGLRSSLSALVGRDVTPTGRGVLAKRDQLTLSAEYAVTEKLSCSLNAQVVHTTDAVAIQGFGTDTIEYENLVAAVQWQLSQSWSAVLNASLRSQDYDSRNDPAIGSSISIGLLWRGNPRAWTR